MMFELLRTLGQSTLASSVALLLILVLRKPMRARFGAHATYALWLLMPLAAAAALLPAPVTSMSMAVVPMFVAPIAAPAVPAAASVGYHPDLTLWLGLTWAGGLMAAAGLLMWQQRRFVRALGRLSAEGERMVRAETSAGCPALVGAWRPRIVLPVDFEERYSATERELILTHERAHRARGDAQANVLAAALRCVYWFNPLVHFAASRFRFDQELACDANVISRFPEARRSYADAMLKTQLADLGLPAGCHWQSSHPLKERIAVLKRPLPGRLRATLGAAIAFALIAGGTYAAWAAQPASAPTAIKNSDASARRADITLTIDSGPPHAIALNPLGEPFTIREGEDNNYWNWQFTSTPGQDGTVEFDNVLMHNGAIVSRPRLIMHDGETGEIRSGEDVEGKFRGFDAHIALARADGTAPAKSAGDASAGYRRLKPIAYPPAALAAKIEGVVYVKVRVSIDGKVTSAAVAPIGAAPDKLLAEAAVSGVQTWTFDPAKKDGHAMESDEVVPIFFRLDREAPPKAAGGTLDAIMISPPQEKSAAASADSGISGPTEIVSYRRAVPPHYPQSAVDAKQGGKIMLKVHVDERGNPVSANVVKADPKEAEAIFGDVSIAATMQWKFNPGTRDGKPVAGDVLVPFLYSIND
jgi:bla regulator protein blaR1